MRRMISIHCIIVQILYVVVIVVTTRTRHAFTVRVLTPLPVLPAIFIFISQSDILKLDNNSHLFEITRTLDLTDITLKYFLSDFFFIFILLFLLLFSLILGLLACHGLFLILRGVLRRLNLIVNNVGLRLI